MVIKPDAPQIQPACRIFCRMLDHQRDSPVPELAEESARRVALAILLLFAPSSGS